MRNLLWLLLLAPFIFLSLGFEIPPGKGVVLTSSNTLVMDGAFTAQSIAQVALEARELDAKLEKGQPLYLVITSPGGVIEAGLELLDNLNALGRPIHTVSTFAASMGFQTVQGLGKRYPTPTGVLMAHKARGGFDGEFPGQLDVRYQFYLKRLQNLDERTVKRSGGKLTLKAFREMYENEYWCEGQDCVDKGLADEAGPVNCDHSLNGTREKVAKIDFMDQSITVILTKAACPTITAVLDAKIKNQGRVINNDLHEIITTFNLNIIDASRLKNLVDEKIREVSFTYGYNVK